MKKVILRTGIYCSLALIVFFLITLGIGKKLSFELQEVIGYVGIILCLIFVYFGIRQYRDKVNGGTLSFGQGIKVGLLIVLLPALLFGIFDVVYSTYINPGFYDAYCSAQLAKLQESVPAAEYEVKSKQIKAQMELFRNNPLFQFIVMALTVIIVGFILTVISTLILRKNKPNTSFD